MAGNQKKIPSILGFKILRFPDVHHRWGGGGGDQGGFETHFVKVNLHQAGWKGFTWADIQILDDVQWLFICGLIFKNVYIILEV